MTTDKKKIAAPPMWEGRPIVDEAHAGDLSAHAASLEFDHHMDRHDAAQSAHEHYVRDQRMGAAAHHLAGIGAAQGAGDLEESRKHGAMFELHMRALGLDPAAPVPQEIQAKLASIDKKKLFRFKPHDADQFAISERTSEPLGKAEACDCEWTHTLSTREQCRAPGSRRVGDKHYCHHHADMAAKMEAIRYRDDGKDPHIETPAALEKSELGLEALAGHAKPWVARDGLEIPRSGTPQRGAWDRKFVTHILGKLGVEHKPRAVRVSVVETIPRNPAVNDARLDLYTKMAKSGEGLPPIMVRRESYGWYVVDGNHRVEAWTRAQRHSEPMDAIDVTPIGPFRAS